MTWFKVDDSFYDHPKVFDAPDCAVALWTRAGTWSARNLTDGFVPTGMPARLCDDPERAVRELINRGLWSRSRGGYQFHDWAQYQPTRDEAIASTRKMSSGGALGNHRKWHTGKGKSNPQCRYCQDEHDRGTHRPPDRVPDTPPESGANPPVPTRPDPKEQPPNPPAGKAGSKRGRPTDDPNFDRFWSAYPKKADKGHALDMWRRHVTNGSTDPEVVIVGAERYRDDPRRKPDYTKNAGTWLNGLCWEDQPARRSSTTSAWWDN